MEVVKVGGGYLHGAQVLTVLKSGGDFVSLRTACLNILDASATKPYDVEVGPGVFEELPFTIPAYVTVKGDGSYSTIIKTLDNADHFITMQPQSMLLRCAVHGPTGVGKAAIYDASNSYIPAVVEDVLIRAGYYGVWCNAVGSFGAIHCINVNNHYVGVAMNQFMRATNFGEIIAIGCYFMSGAPGAVDVGFYATGANAQLSLHQCGFRNAGSTDGIYLDAGARCRALGMNFSAGTNAVHVGPTAGGTRFNGSGCLIRTLPGFTGKDLWVESVDAVFRYDGTAHKSKMTTNPAATFVVVCTDDDTPAGLVVCGELQLGDINSAVPLGSYTRTYISTGWASGGEVTRHETPSTTLKVNVAAGTGYVNRGGTLGVVKVSWSAVHELELTDDSRQYIYVDYTGAVDHAPTRPEFDEYILLAVAQTAGGKVEALTSLLVNLQQPYTRAYEVLKETVGPVTAYGCEASQSATAKKLNVASGEFYIGTQELNPAGGNDITFTRWYRNVATWTAVNSVDTVDTTNYNPPGGALVAIDVGPNKFKKDALYMTCDINGNMEFHLVYGQEQFVDAPAALAGNMPTPPDFFTLNALLLAGVVSEAAAADTNSVQDQRTFIGQLRSGTTAVGNDHDLLLNRDHDGHPQYHTDARGDLRYIQLTNGSFAALTNKALMGDTDLIVIEQATGEKRKVLRTSMGFGKGDVVGPGGATDTAIALFDTATGKLLKNSVVTVTAGGNIATPGTVDGRDVGNDGAVLDLVVPAVSGHIANMSNPHATTKIQVGLGNVTNNAQVIAPAGPVTDFGEMSFSGTGGASIQNVGVRNFGRSAADPVAPAGGFIGGDRYYNTTLNLWLVYDATRLKFLSIETVAFKAGASGNVASGNYYQDVFGSVMSATAGFNAPFNGTIIRMSYTRSDTDAATFELMDDGATMAAGTLASAATKGKKTDFNCDFAADSVLAVRNQAGGNTTSAVNATIWLKWRG